MRERAHDIVSGARILLHALQLDCAYIVVESDKPEAMQQLAAAMTDAGDARLTLKQIPTIYPSGGEDQLVQLVTNREVPSGGLPTDIGCLVQNVGTAAAIHAACRDRRIRRRLHGKCEAPGDRRPDDRQGCQH